MSEVQKKFKSKSYPDREWFISKEDKEKDAYILKCVNGGVDEAVGLSEITVTTSAFWDNFEEIQDGTKAPQEPTEETEKSNDKEEDFEYFEKSLEKDVDEELEKGAGTKGVLMTIKRKLRENKPVEAYIIVDQLMKRMEGKPETAKK